MIYLSGTRHHVALKLAREFDVGIIVQPGNRYHGLVLHYRWWAADNGCYAQGDGFDADRWIRWLDGRPRERCLFATAPDVLGDPVATQARSEPWLPVIRELGFPAALVAQDGLEAPDWDTFDCLFVGGTDAWKESDAATALALEARRRGKWTHLGRVNTQRRFRYAAGAGYRSVDGTFLRYGGDTPARMRRWLEWDQHRRPSLWESLP